ncbi:metallophosphoesterase [Methanoculleus sp. FWC-SCC1]|uniref:Phosphoesterase n=1 Tax=Methanoculleus frigidifontis TaxID=2584085 RepID=A0ABT8M7E8_9EURY|nr:metallophosphoesterase [Methanoculleus sp. FWC-SCC1]MDN7023859.1 metallophosphoesterase [Methanoculleus sp. FWC-SCC1]
MLVGLISDTHDNLPLTRRAVTALNDACVDLVLHAGDYVAPFVIPVLADLDAPLIGVLGNNDGDLPLLQARFAKNAGMELRGRFACVTADDTTIGLLHGDEGELLQGLIEREAFDVIVHGHTHKARVSEGKATLVVNPGEVCGYLSGQATAALLDTDTNNVTILHL